MVMRAFRGLKPRMPLWRVTTAVTAAAFLAALISWLPIVAELPTGGCMALGLFVMGGMTLFLLVGWFCLAAVAGIGSFLSYRGSQFGLYLVVAPSLILMVYFGSFGLATAGQFAWACIVIAVSFLPIIAAFLAAAQLVLRGANGHTVGAFVAMLAVGLLLPTVGQGWLQDLSNASETPLQPISAANHTAC